MGAGRAELDACAAEAEERQCYSDIVGRNGEATTVVTVMQVAVAVAVAVRQWDAAGATDRRGWTRGGVGQGSPRSSLLPWCSGRDDMLEWGITSRSLELPYCSM